MFACRKNDTDEWAWRQTLTAAVALASNVCENCSTIHSVFSLMSQLSSILQRRVNTLRFSTHMLWVGRMPAKCGKRNPLCCTTFVLGVIRCSILRSLTNPMHRCGGCFSSVIVQQFSLSSECGDAQNYMALSVITKPSVWAQAGIILECIALARTKFVFCTQLSSHYDVDVY